jgi:signal transduction histidine kinase
MSRQPSKPSDVPVVDRDVRSVSSPQSCSPAGDRTDDWSGVLGKAHSSSGAVKKHYRRSTASLESSPDAIARSIVTGSRSFCSKESDHSQSLRSKLVLALALMLGVVVGIDEIVRQQVIAPEFANLERVAALKDTNRVLSAINTEIEFLAETAAHEVTKVREDWFRKPDPRFKSGSSVPSQTAEHVFRGRIELAAVATVSGDWTWLKTGSGRQADTPNRDTHSPRLEFPGVTSSLSQSKSPEVGKIQGMTRGSDEQLYLFAALPLARATDSPLDQQVAAESEAYYVAIRRFGDQAVSDLEHRTSVRFWIGRIGKGASIDKSVRIEPNDDSFLSVTSPLVSPSGQPLAELNVRLPREVTNRSNRTTAFARYLSLCGACVSLLLLLLLLQRIVIGRLETIREHTERIAESGIISDESTLPVLRVAGHDEIGQLAKSFDRMRNRLGDAQRRLSDASHAAGMSLVADTVIHNVGNVLTNVNSLIETASRRVDNLRIEPLEKLAIRLRSDQVDRALQNATPGYLQRLSETLEDDKDDLAALLQTLSDNVQHIHQVIRDQRRHAQQPVKWVRVDLESVVDEAVRCSHATLEKDNVDVVYNGDLDVRIWTDRSLLLQILINIIGNAGNATRDLIDRQPTLRIDLIRTQTTAHIRFRDNGCGMAPETLSQVFDAHFTTRRSGSGLGLHFCAIAMKRIGGSIHAESDGPDAGATFIVEVPVKQPLPDNKSASSIANEPEGNRPVRDSILPGVPPILGGK